MLTVMEATLNGSGSSFAGDLFINGVCFHDVPPPKPQIGDIYFDKRDLCQYAWTGSVWVMMMATPEPATKQYVDTYVPPKKSKRCGYCRSLRVENKTHCPSCAASY